jgi:acyl-coenzyme A thioesterase PaaI-like protein
MTEMTRDIGVDSAQSEPRGTLSIRTLAMPADTNQYGDIFGGWLLGQMDVAGGIFAANIAKSRTATVAVDAMTSASRSMSEMSCASILISDEWARLQLKFTSKPG